MRGPILASFHTTRDWESSVDDLRRGHTEIYRAIAAGDEAAAAARVEEHIRFAFSLLEWKRPTPHPEG